MMMGTRRGRPRKFSRPSRSVTLTLPEDVIAGLLTLDTDLSRAVVRAMQPLTPEPFPASAELVTYGLSAVISVPPTAALRERAGVDLVPLSDGRALISFDEGMSVEQLELRVRDALADPALQSSDRQVFDVLADILQTSRRGDGMELRRRRIVVLHSTGAARQET
jgi:hypothetical protein